MAIDDEPRNGDYAAYIEALSRRGAGPGQTLRQLDSGTLRVGTQGQIGESRFSEPATASQSGWAGMPDNLGTPEREVFPTAGSGTAPYTPYTPRPAAAPAQRQHGEPDTHHIDMLEQEPTTLAQRRRQQRATLWLLLVGIVSALTGLGLVIEGVVGDGDTALGFLLLPFAWIFLRAGWRYRRRAGIPLAKLPPLTTISSRHHRT